MKWSRRKIGILIFIVLFISSHLFLDYIPNPMVSGGMVALNMIFPVLAGFLYGPRAGFACGAVSTGLGTLVYGSLFGAATIFPQTLMGLTAGLLGRKGSEFISSLSIFVGHILNIVFFYKFGLLEINLEQLKMTLFGIFSEATIDIVIIVILGTLLKKRFFEVDRC